MWIGRWYVSSSFFTFSPLPLPLPRRFSSHLVFHAHFLFPYMLTYLLRTLKIEADGQIEVRSTKWRVLGCCLCTYSYRAITFLLFPSLLFN
ncbi:hypothetical protein BKA65DRAFT_518412 [Rhexocercosporidium sp. MPI-PUGE-AT-0058]|nr:hypothetical protein BKA65DRAFT_518412 [Rhexocercosporidium sp. MPI-PUGE-AT-0058]